MSKNKKNTITAYCWRNGQIQFGRTVPEGAIAIISGNQRKVRDKIDACARWSYPSKRGAGDSVPLVPGIPEASSPEAALDALHRFTTWIKKSWEAV